MLPLDVAPAKDSGPIDSVNVEGQIVKKPRQERGDNED
jgi:hypothetical protein